MPKKNGKKGGNFRRNQVYGNGSGPSRQPRVSMLKKLQYTSTVTLDNATSTYSYFADYMTPDITKCDGADVQFAAYELWRIKRLRVSIQNASQTDTGISQLNINDVSNTTIWTAADYGANEDYPGASLMQYQNAKKNTLSLNKFTTIVDTPCRINTNLGLGGKSSDFVLDASTWVSTTKFDSSFYSGYQMFIQNFGSQSYEPGKQPSMTIVTEFIVEFLQPAFQNNAAAFSTRCFNMRMVTQPDASDPTIKRAYVFNWYKVHEVDGVREFQIHLIREDGESGSLTYNNTELRAAISTGTSGKYFNARRATYDGPMPPIDIPAIDYSFGDVPTS